MPTTIKLRNSVTTTSAPSSLVQGEVAINITDKKVWVGNAATTPIQLLGDGGSASFTSIAFGAGTVSNPSITFTGDTNTGIYSPAADTIAFTEGGVESMRIDSSGNVGIGTSSPATRLNVFSSTTNTARIRVTGTGSTTGNFRGYEFGSSGGFSGGIFQDEGTSALSFWSTSGGESMRITSGGNVGIGTSSPSSGASFLTVTELYGATNCSYAINAAGSHRADFGISSSGGWLGTNTNTDMRFVTNNTERMRITSGGDVQIATTGVYLRLKSASTDFDFSGQAGGTDFLRLNANGTQRFQFNAAGQAYNSTGTWGTISDARLKENIADATPKLDSLNQLRVVNFNFKDEPDVKQIGFIAQEVEQVFPGLVSEGESDGEGGYYKAVKTTVLIPMLVKAIQEQQAMIVELTNRIKKLEGA